MSKTVITPNRILKNKKPSDFFGTLSAAEGEKFQEYVSHSRLEWERIN